MALGADAGDALQYAVEIFIFNPYTLLKAWLDELSQENILFW